MKRTLLVVGATGLLGRAALIHFRDLEGWDVIGLSRRDPGIAGAAHIAADLTDPNSLAAARSRLSSVTHVFYAALYEMEDLVSGWRHERQMAVNDAMFRNLMGAVEGSAPDLAHVHVLQGTKAYGIHVEPMRAPAKERWPRHAHDNFYWLQEDYLRERRAKADWRYTIWRPQAVFGYALGSPMNLVAAVGVYAAIAKAEGRPLDYPGGPPIVSEATDARLLARAVEWSADAETAWDETFNITNGDILIWPNVWPTVAEHFGLELGTTRPETLVQTMPAKETLWAEIVARRGLQQLTLEQMIGGSWQFLDRAMRAHAEPAPPSLVSTIKLRQAGFGDCLDTEDSLRFWFSEMQREKLLPP